MARLTGIKAIKQYMGIQSDATIMDRIQLQGMPATKIGGIWESETDLIDKWRREQIEKSVLGVPQRAPVRDERDKSGKKQERARRF